MKKLLLLSIVFVFALSMISIGGGEKKQALAVEKEYMPTVGLISTEEYKPEIHKAEKKWLVGFANYMRAAPFCLSVEEGMIKYAEEAGVELFVVDNAADPARAVDNARMMIVKGVDFFIEYQGHAETNVVIGEMLKEAGIPTLAIDIVVPGSPFFGGNNYEAGGLAGKWLGKYASENWAGEHVVLVLLESTTNGMINAIRMQGYIDGVAEYVPEILGGVYRLDTNNSYEDSMDKMRTWLSGHPDEHHIVVGSLHDGPGAGGMAALREANREADAVICSQGADPSIYPEIRDPESCYKGSVAYFPEKYGFYCISIALDVLEGNPVPEEVFVSHVTIDATNIDKYYPEK